MKKIYTILFAVLLTVTVFLPQQAGAQSPEKMSYQAVVRDASDNIVAGTSVGMQISILQGSIDGTPVYVETQTTASNANGLVSIEIGSTNATVVSGDFSTIDWANSTYFIKTETDITGGTRYTITGTSQLLSVPYALHAKTAETVTGEVTVTETDPTFTAWDKSTGISITESRISDLNHFANTDETDPIFTESIAGGITATDTANWNKETGSFIESDPIYSASQAANIIAADITNLENLSGVNTGDQDLSSFATKAYVDALEERIILLEGVNDYDGNEYEVVKIGNQVWMAENLQTIKYNDGTVIPLVTDNSSWSALTTGAYCWYNNDEANNKDIYGALYNWYTVNTGKLCPEGWHVPTDAEWTILTDYLGGSSVAGGKLKESGTTNWDTPNLGATNETGFTALPVGSRFAADGSYNHRGTYNNWWTVTGNNTTDAANRYMYYNSASVHIGNNLKGAGFSIRCVKD